MVISRSHEISTILHVSEVTAMSFDAMTPRSSFYLHLMAIMLQKSTPFALKRES